MSPTYCSHMTHVGRGYVLLRSARPATCDSLESAHTLGSEVQRDWHSARPSQECRCLNLWCSRAVMGLVVLPLASVLTAMDISTSGARSSLPFLSVCDLQGGYRIQGNLSGQSTQL